MLGIDTEGPENGVRRGDPCRSTPTQAEAKAKVPLPVDKPHTIHDALQSSTYAHTEYN
jgi:hypothetical protein